MIKKKAGSGCK